jgi:hypothetical protein
MSELNPFAVMMGILDAAASAARQPNSAGGPMDWPAWSFAVGTVGKFIVALVILAIPGSLCLRYPVRKAGLRSRWEVIKVPIVGHR